MSLGFWLCSACQRHVRCGESSCPFCGSEKLASACRAAPRGWRGLRYGRAVVGASAGLLATMVGCGPSHTTSMAVYGAPCAPNCMPYDSGADGNDGAAIDAGNDAADSAAPDVGSDSAAPDAAPDGSDAATAQDSGAGDAAKDAQGD